MASRPALYRGKAVRAIMGRFTATQSPWPSLHPTDYREDTPGPRSVFAVFQLHYQTSIYTVPIYTLRPAVTSGRKTWRASRLRPLPG